MLKKNYTDLQKAEVLKKAAETSVAEASRKYGVDEKTIRKWRSAANVDAEKIEVKKNVRDAERKVKEKVSTAKEKAAVKKIEKKAEKQEVKAAAAATVKDDKDAAKIEAKKKTRAAGRKVKETVAPAAEAVKKTAAKAKAAKVNLVFESVLGGVITPDQIIGKLPKEATDAYVKIEENTIYWVGKNGEMGSVDIW